MDGKFEMAAFEKWSGAQDFAFSVILEFLKLQDIVKILTIVHRSGLKFVPSPALLSEIVLKALLRHLPSVTSLGYQIKFEHLPSAMIISEKKTLTLQTIPKLYDFIKGSVMSEFEQHIGITVNDSTCVFMNAVEEDRAEGLRFKVIFECSQCSDEECNMIVLWHCSICEYPNSECSEHVTTCEYCEGEICKDCLLYEDICKDCGFICSECGDVFVERDVSDKIICEGSICGGSGPYCLDCAELHNDLEISTSTGCNTMACGECRPHINCSQVRKEIK
jgi:hypothetical protein